MADDTPDPLAALRAQDARPAIDRWRDRLASRPRLEQVPPWMFLVAIACVALIVTRSLTEPGAPDLASVVPLAEPSRVTVGSTEAPDAIVVLHVAGAVAQPGLVEGRDTWRVADALRAAGGAGSDADLDRLNLAAPVRDGERIFVPKHGETVVAIAGTTDPAAAPGPIDLNAATAAELEDLPGVGPATAAAIVSHRDEHGAFGDVDALVAVRGIGPAKLDAIRDHVVVR